jgi:hypothetical protein
MNIPARRAAPALAALIALFFGCTQDFDQFAPSGVSSSSSSGVGPGASSSGPGGTGGAAATSTTSTTVASTTGVGGSGGAGGGGGVGGVGGTPLEDCLDGTDNDNDGDADCADADCTPGVECVDPAPMGWEGYFRIHTLPFADMTSSNCPDGMPPETYYDTPNISECSPCTCGNWTGAACDPPPIDCWDESATCMGPEMLDVSGILPDGTCYQVPNIPGQGTPRSCRLTGPASVAEDGSCPVGGGAQLNPDPWVNRDDVCGVGAQIGGGCGGSQVCIPRGGGDYMGPVCIRKMDQDTCPPSYPTPIEAATGEMDGRMCEGCDCAVSGVTCTGGSYTVYNQDNCTDEPTPINSMNCVNVSNQLDSNTGSIKANTPTPAGGMCTPSGGAATGTVMPTGVVTFCCKQ